MKWLPKLPKADLPRLTAWVELLRSVAALLFIPFLCLYAAGFVFLLWQFGHLGPESVRLHVVDWFGYALLGTLALIGLGVLWLQKRDIPDVTVQGPGGFSVGINNDNKETTVEVNSDQV